jgi:hypothetical protein
VDILSNFAEFTDERLAEYLAEVRAAFDDLAALDEPTDEQLDEAEQYADHIEALIAEQGSRTERAAARADRAAALRGRFTEGDVEPNDEEEVEVDSAEDEIEAAAEEDEPPAQVAAAKPTKKVAALAKKVTRPAVTANVRAPAVITAAADVPEFATGSELDGLMAAGQAAINRMRGFPIPTAGDDDPSHEEWHHYGVAQIKVPFPDDLTIDRYSDDMEVLTHAANEHRLPGKSLVAAGGWCAPSETLYDLCAGETLEGILSVPETNWARGGIKFTSGPDFAAIYSNVGFCQTEAQAIAGTPDKPCFEVPCPTFSEVRLEACGLCLRIPLLTQSGYPELIQRWMSGSLIAYAHKQNAKTIAAMVTAAGTAKTVTPFGSTAADSLGALELMADGIRSKYRLSMTASLEVVVPWFAKGMYRSDLRNRTGQESPVTDQQIAAEFAARNLAVQYVYDWQDTPFPAGTAPAIAYPTTYQALMYPAGTFIKGTNDIINLNAVYDAASLAKNTYTGLFFEEGWGLAKLCYEAQLVTLPVCNAGRTGAANLTCA